jgi:flagellar biogenesis protein FliO
MDEIRQALAVLTVLGILAGTLWWLRRKGLAQFALKPGSAGRTRHMKVVERLTLTPQHSLHLVRVGSRTVLIAASPSRCALLDSAVEPPVEGIAR